MLGLDTNWILIHINYIGRRCRLGRGSQLVFNFFQCLKERHVFVKIVVNELVRGHFWLWY